MVSQVCITTSLVLILGCLSLLPLASSFALLPPTVRVHSFVPAPPHLRRRQQPQQWTSSSCAPLLQSNRMEDTDIPIEGGKEEEEEDDPLAPRPKEGQPFSSSSSRTPRRRRRRRRRQHWLDLRGTAIRPEEALAFFDEFLVDHPSATANSDKNKEKRKDEEEEQDGSTTTTISQTVRDMIDCILVPSKTFRDISNKAAFLASSSAVDILVVAQQQDGSTTVAHDIHGEPKGTFFSSGSRRSRKGSSSSSSSYYNINPLDSLDLYNRGDYWILFEASPDGGTDSEEMAAWVNHIESLLQLLPAMASPGRSQLETPSGLILPFHNNQDNHKDSDDESNESDNNNCFTKAGGGGVGICCPTREAVFRVDTLLEQVTSSAGSTEFAQSGILLLADNNNNNDNSASSSSSSSSMPITSALILPFDLNLWRAVLELRQETTL